MLDVYDHVVAGIRNGKRGLPTCGINGSGICPDAGIGKMTDFTVQIRAEASRPPKIINEKAEYMSKILKERIEDMIFDLKLNRHIILSIRRSVGKADDFILIDNTVSAIDELLIKTGAKKRQAVEQHTTDKQG